MNLPSTTIPSSAEPSATPAPSRFVRVGCLVDCISRDAGGLQTSVRRLMQLLQNDRTELAVFSVLDKHTEADAAAWSPVNINVERGVGPRILGFAPFLGEALEKYDPDILNTHGLWTYTSVVSSQWQKKTGKPVIIHPHGMLDPWALKNSGWKKQIALLAFERSHLRNAACIRALCESEKASIRKLGLNNPVCVIPNGIDIPEGGFAPAKPPTWGRKHKLLYLGRIHPKKGLPELIKAWARLQGQSGMEDWQLQIAGWDQGGHEHALQSQASKAGLSWREIPPNSESTESDAPLVFTGSRFGQAKDAIYAGCDAFILPSVSEGLPMVVLEAWAHAKPALITPMCNLPEGPAAGAALEIEPKAESIAQGILELVRMSPERRAEIGHRGLDLVRQRFTWTTIASQLAEVNDWLLHGGERPAHVHL